MVRAVRLGQGDDPRVGSVEAVDVTFATGRAGRDDRVARGGPQDLVLGILGVPALALAADEAEHRAGLGGEDVAVHVRRGHLRDVPRGGQPCDRLGREATAVGGRRVGPDLLLGRIDDVQVVQAARARPQEGVDAHDVVAERGGALERDPGERALARVVGRAPAPQDVLRVEDQQVLATDAQVARGRDGPALVLRAGPGDEGGRLGLEVDPVDGLGGLVDDVRVAVRTADHRAQVEGRGLGRRLERVDPGRGDGHDPVQAVQAGLDLLQERAR